MPADRPLIRRVFEDFRSSGFHFQEMIISMMKARETPQAGEFPVQGRANVAGNH
jgi:hypothetical protein